jgi:hypothetical protein
MVLFLDICWTIPNLEILVSSLLGSPLQSLGLVPKSVGRNDDLYLKIVSTRISQSGEMIDIYLKIVWTKG